MMPRPISSTSLPVKLAFRALERQGYIYLHGNIVKLVRKLVESDASGVLEVYLLEMSSRFKNF